MSAMSGSREATLNDTDMSPSYRLFPVVCRVSARSRESTSGLAVADVGPGGVGVVFGRLLRKAVSATSGKCFRF